VVDDPGEDIIKGLLSDAILYHILQTLRHRLEMREENAGE